jgi:ligand-binding SRPBCC domain-containing protein
MNTIHLTTLIAAPIERVFDLSRSVNLHKISTAHTHEKIIDGVSSGLINEGETVTWQAKHLFKERTFTSRISSMISPDSFVDEMVKGDFKSFRHQHHFKQIDNGTIMIDLLQFETPYGFIGAMVNKFFLHHYLERLLIKRNEVIKEYAESKKWVSILPAPANQ